MSRRQRVDDGCFHRLKNVWHQDEKLAVWFCNIFRNLSDFFVLLGEVEQLINCSAIILRTTGNNRNVFFFLKQIQLQVTTDECGMRARIQVDIVKQRKLKGGFQTDAFFFTQRQRIRSTWKLHDLYIPYESRKRAWTFGISPARIDVIRPRKQFTFHHVTGRTAS